MQPETMGGGNGTSVEVTVKGKWVMVPAVRINETILTIRGKLVKLAAVHEEWWLEKELENPEAYCDQLKSAANGIRADVFTFAQKVPGSRPKYDFAFEWESVAATRTDNFKRWWEGLPQESRKNVRRAQRRGVTISVKTLDDDLIRGIMGVNNDSSMRQGEPNLYYGKSFEETRKSYSSFPERSDFVCAYFGEELIGFLKIVYRGEVAAILNLATKASHSDKRPANAVMAKAVELCEQKGAHYLTYGYFNYGNKRHSPLREFKIRNGFQEMLTPKFYVPLTPWGAFCMELKLHRGLIGILPHSLITFAVAARSKWYNFRYSPGRCSSMPEQPNRIRQMECSNPPAGSNL